MGGQKIEGERGIGGAVDRVSVGLKTRDADGGGGGGGWISGNGGGGKGRGDDGDGGEEGMEPLLAIHVRSEAKIPPDPMNSAWNVTLEAMGR